MQPSPTSPKSAITTHSRGALSSASAASDTNVPPSSTSDSGYPMSFAAYLKSWDDNQVSLWLHDHRCGSHADIFAEHDIRGDVLLELDNSTLKEMGITSVGDRVRILSAVKQLRQQLSRSKQSAPIISASAPTNSTTFADGNSPQKQSRRLDGARPPPLPLHLIHNVRPPISVTGTLTGDSTTSTPGRTPQGFPGPPSHRPHLPPALPPPKSQPPLPPTPNNHPPRPLAIPSQPSHLSGRRTPIQESTTPVSGAWQGEYGLPARPSPGNVGSKPNLSRSASPSQLGQGSAKRSGTSSGIPSGSSSSLRLPTHERAHSLPGSNPTPNPHPYASSSQALQPNANLNNPLSPIEESTLTPASGSGNPSFPSSSRSEDYRVGRGPFTSKSVGSHPTPTIEDIRRVTIKFNLPEEGVSRLVHISDCVDGIKVLERVLKKFNKLSTTPRGESDPGYLDIDDVGGLVVDGWGVFLPSNCDNPEARPLTEAELLNICHAEPTHPVREQGLTLRMVSTSKLKRTKLSGPSIAEQPPISIRRSPPGSPTKPSSISSQNGNRATGDGMLGPNESSKRTKRASAISILSGLGVQGTDRPSSPESDTTSLRSVKPTNNTTSRLRKFFGQRPPSELIQHHLQDYFPNTEKKVIKRAYRKSILRQNRDRQSIIVDTGWGGSRESQILPSRFSVSSMGSLPRRSLSDKRRSSMFAATPIGQVEEVKPNEDRPIPRVSVSTESGESHDLTQDDDTASKASTPRSNRFPQLLPPVSLDKEKFSDSFELLPGMNDSGPSQSFPPDSKLKRELSEANSMLTIDEITAEVESRRNSIITSASGIAEGGAKVRDSLAVPFPIIEDKTLEDEFADEDSEYYDSDGYDDDDGGGTAVAGSDSKTEDDDTLMDEGDEGPSKAVTSKGGMRSIKWIKGALIGKGSFGSVYLAMDAQRGLLMAVKQVELPTGSTQNEERKKGMLTALEREIDLLKDLQHENIVQYLDSSTDDACLNIFLEYVPGGSVAALLRNYGAFEEALVRNFVRQILQGLAYLHGRDIIHRDIKGANILVDNKSCVKISDFGISKKVEDSMNKAHRPSFQGSAFWMAPEVVKQTSYTAKADIWSLGCLCVEMLTGEHPWANLTQMQAIFKIGSSAKPAIPSDVTSDADEFMQKTFDLDYQARPSADKLLEHPWVAYDPLLSFAAANAALNQANSTTLPL